MKRLQPALNASIQATLDLIFPRQCVSCNGLVQSNNIKYLCSECLKQIFWIKPPYCLTCGFPFYGIAKSVGHCPHCYELNPVFKTGHSVFFIKNSGQQLIHAFKYHQGLYLLNDIKNILKKNTALHTFFKNAILVPVPLHPRKKRERGFNQSLLIAQCLTAVYEEVTIEEALLRVIDTPSQTRLNRTKRQHNLRKAFALKKGVPLQKDKKYIVVDDVFTTGATLNACCRVLKKAGLENLHIFTLSHG